MATAAKQRKAHARKARVTSNPKVNKYRQNSQKTAQQNAGGRVDQTIAMDLLSKIADLLCKDPEQDYNQTPTMKSVVIEWMNSQNSFHGYTQAFDTLRDNLDSYLAQHFDAHIDGGPLAMLQDVQEHLIEQGVPRKMRVMAGVVDLLGFYVYVGSGQIEFYNVEAA